MSTFEIECDEGTLSLAGAPGDIEIGITNQFDEIALMVPKDQAIALARWIIENVGE